MDLPPPALPRRPPALLRRTFAADLCLAAALAAVTLALGWSLIAKFGGNWKMIYAVGSAAAWHRLLITWWLASAAGLGALPFRRRFPLAVFAVTLAMAAVHFAEAPFGLSPADLAVPIALYSLAAAAPRRVSLSALGAGIVLAAAASTVIGSSLHAGWLMQPNSVLTSGLAVAAAWFAGDGSQTRRAYLAEVERRASDAERDRDRQAQLAVAAERSRISGELHDVIAHALSVIVIQAQGAGSALRRREPEETSEALDAIVTTGRDALAETRALLGIIHRPGSELPVLAPQPLLAPQPRLADVGQLIDQVRRAGTTVEVHVEGTHRELAAGLELAAYRIIQESLTNTLKHAGPSARAAVRISYGEADLILEVTDNGSPETDRVPCADGHGLNGMRARAAVLGGEVIAGRDSRGGFRVRARLPIKIPVG